MNEENAKQTDEQFIKDTIAQFKKPTVEMSVKLYPEECLRKKCEEITDATNKDIVKFCRDLHLYCRKNQALGLSAPQVGFNKRIIVINENIKEAQGRDTIFINPVISNGSGKSRFKEGCLSLPEIYAYVERYNYIDIDYIDIHGKEKKMTINDVANDLYGTIIQHEIDHLDGVLFIDKLNSFEMEKVYRKINKMRK